ncbi:MAG: hypothetical protein GWN58_13735, partial [Anaerolineae bacterium]|nr:hypothetical protein [Anaerolineae bacterium]
EHLASMLLRPSADRERWEQLTGAIGKWQRATVGQRGGMVRGIRELALGEADLETEAGL